MSRPRNSFATLVLVIITNLFSHNAFASGPFVEGAWSSPHYWLFFEEQAPFLNWRQAVHAIVLKNGKVLCFPYHDASKPFIWTPPAIGTPGIGSFKLLDHPHVGIFPFHVYCSGHAQLPDGRVFLAGGGLGPGDGAHDHAFLFDPDRIGDCISSTCVGGQFHGVGCSADAECFDPWILVSSPMPGTDCGNPPEPSLGVRWYPTCTALHDGTILVLGGDGPYGQWESFHCAGTPCHNSDIPLIFHPSAEPCNPWTRLTDGAKHLPYYPYAFQLADGQVLYAGFESNNPLHDEDPCPDPMEGPNLHFGLEEAIETQMLNLQNGNWSVVDEEPHRPGVVAGGGGFDCHVRARQIP